VSYAIGDLVFWGTPTTAGEYTFIDHPRGDKAGKVLVLAHSVRTMPRGIWVGVGVGVGVWIGVWVGVLTGR
jgi:hypothetical protein